MVVLCLLLFTFLTNIIGFHNKYPFVPNKQNIIIMGCDYYIETDLEIRASWSPDSADLANHIAAWLALVEKSSGLMPLPDGVSALSRKR